MAAKAPVNEKTDLITFTILSEGKEIDGSYQVQSITVKKGVNRISMAQLEIIDGSASEEDFTISDSNDFIPGNKIEIKAGYHFDNQTLFSGIILSQGLRVRPGKASVLVVECRDTAIKMTVGRKNKYYLKVKDSDIISTLIGTYSGLSATVEATTVTYKELVQYYVSDWDFMIARADVNGQVVLADNGKITVKKPDTSQAAVLSLQYGYTMLDFNADVDALTQYASVESTAWDMKKQTTQSAASQNPNLTTPGNLSSATLAKVIGLSKLALQSPVPLEKDSLQAWSNAQLIKSQMAKVKGTVSFQGNVNAVPGKLLALSGLGARFNGNAYISEVTHSISEGKWITEAGFGLSEEWYTETKANIESPQASGLLPAIGGLHQGTVKQIQKDPDGELRVLVNVPLIATSGDGIWARLSNFYATANAGQFFYPETGDEVVLGFFNEDPSFPVILGSLYSSAKKAPFTPDEKNSTKAIVTKSQLKITFDEENKVIEILTPGNNKVTLDDKNKALTLSDSHSNKITMDSSGITLNSASAINLKAKTDISIKAGGSLTLSATSDTKISGMNIKGEAKMQAVLKGSASAELSATGQVTVKGAMVMIN